MGALRLSGHDLDDPRGEPPDGTWEFLPYKVIGPCTYQYEPPTKPWGGSLALEINVLPYLGSYEVDKEKRILRITKCPNGQPSGHPDGGLVDLVFYYDTPKSAQPEYYELSPDERDRKLFRRYYPR